MTTNRPKRRRPHFNDILYGGSSATDKERHLMLFIQEAIDEKARRERKKGSSVATTLSLMRPLELTVHDKASGVSVSLKPIFS